MKRIRKRKFDPSEPVTRQDFLDRYDRVKRYHAELSMILSPACDLFK